MIDDFAKEYLHASLRNVRASLLWKLDGLGEYDIRRPLTPTGTNLLGLVKHLSVSEAMYFGDVFGRPFTDLPQHWFDEQDLLLPSMWATADESRDEVVDRYRRACDHADATITELPIDAPGHVPWWPNPDVQLFNVLVHLVAETNRHAGHADILREQTDGSIGASPDYPPPERYDAAFWENHRAEIEEAARAASS
jgi:hypothetical protein